MKRFNSRRTHALAHVDWLFILELLFLPKISPLIDNWNSCNFTLYLFNMTAVVAFELSWCTQSFAHVESLCLRACWHWPKLKFTFTHTRNLFAMLVALWRKSRPYSLNFNESWWSIFSSAIGRLTFFYCPFCPALMSLVKKRKSWQSWSNTAKLNIDDKGNRFVWKTYPSCPLAIMSQRALIEIALNCM